MAESRPGKWGSPILPPTRTFQPLPSFQQTCLDRNKNPFLFLFEYIYIFPQRVAKKCKLPEILTKSLIDKFFKMSV